MIQVETEGKKYTVAPYSSSLDVFKAAGLVDGTCNGRIPDYEKNPIVGSLVNGVLSSVSEPIPCPCSIEPVRVFEDFGRRIYRHSICFLLCYASWSLYPKRALVIGHSLGDGFYFNFADGNPCTEEDVSAIGSRMRQLVSSATDIGFVTVTLQEAVAHLRDQGFDDAVMLLENRNRNFVDMYRIEDYYHIAYEPIVSNTWILSKWELRRYGSAGMLLRYPVRDSITHVLPFKDQNRLFEVFEEYRNWGRILGVRCVGEMNRRYLDNTACEYVRLSEDLQRRKISSIADQVCERGARAVFVAGPSSSGKTTFAKKLCEQFKLLGFSPIRISLDDYYRKRELAPKDEDGKPDLEALEALDTDLFDRNMRDLFNGLEVDLPHFSFVRNGTYYLNRPIRLEKNTIFVIEGIHGLNPRIVSGIDPKLVYKVYISALTQLNMDDCNRVSTTDDRMLRRILRDHRTRATSATETLLMWPSVSRGERRHIFPNQNNADMMFNSALDYELGVLSPFVLPLLHEVSPSAGSAYTQARRLIRFLENIAPIPAKFVPSDSILREFIGDSDYDD